jgi:predicted TIM-barrel fold metal-dependent hydrolase
MLDDAAAAVGAARLLWGCDITMCTGLAKLWALEHTGMSRESQRDVRWRNAARIFPAGTFASAEAGHG